MKLKLNLKRVACGVVGFAAVAAAAGVVPATSASALPPGTAPNGAVTLSVPNGTSATSFVVQQPIGAACAGTGDQGYRVNTYIAPVATDIPSLLYDAGGSPIGGGSLSLRNAAGAQLRNVSPAIGNNFISPVTASFNFSSWSGFTPGAYNIGLACTLPVITVAAVGTVGAVGYISPVFEIQTQSFYNVPITITAAAGAGPNSFNYAFGAVPSAPARPTVTAAAPSATTGSVSVAYVAPTATPAVLDYSIQLTPKVGFGAAQNIPNVTTNPYVFPAGAVVEGIYNVTVTARNSTGAGLASPPSEDVIVAGVGAPPTLLGAPAANPQGNIPVKISTPTVVTAGGFTAGETVVITFRSTPIVIGTVVDGVNPGVAGNLGDTDGVANGSVTVSVIIPVNDGDGVSSLLGPHSIVLAGNTSGNVASVGIQPVPINNGQLSQNVIVTVPVGVITFTQTCGKFGAIAGTTTPLTNGVPAFTWPAQLVNNPAAASGTLNNGVTTLTVPAPVRGTATCNILMSTPVLVEDNTATALNGAYYSAVGSLNQVTVVDSRDSDLGWKVQGRLTGPFTKTAPPDTFSGNYLGWYPAPVAIPPATPEGYVRTVTAGSAVLPGTGVLPTGGTPASMTASGRLLASTPNPVAGGLPGAGSGGLGRTDLDARMAMYIPLTDSDPGTYTATLELTLLDL